MSRLVVLFALCGFVGLTLLLSELRWFRRVSLVDRLRPYSSPGHRHHRSGLFSVDSFREVVAPLSQAIGEQLARLFGVREDLGTRLRRTHSPLGVAEFRVRQIGWSTAAFAGALLFAVAAVLSIPVAVATILAAPILAFLIVEQQIARASAAWQRRIFLELAVVTEQIGMLLAAGWSLGAAIGRIADRGAGACAADLGRVQSRMRQGLSDVDALQEWATLADVDELDKLVSVLALNRDAADLGRLIGEEARSIRRQAQRELIESIERRTQQVWIPVTVAALVPGVLLMGVPFIDALSLFST